MGVDKLKKPRSFQEIIMRLNQYWSDKGCAILQPYDMEVGAGTFHPATTRLELSVQSLGLWLMFKLVVDQQMVDMVRIQIDYNIIINIKF